MESHIFETFKSEPFFQIKATLSNGNILLLKWNIFKDKKNDFKPVIRTRYVLHDKDLKRLSLKSLNLKEEVQYKEIELTDLTTEILDNLYYIRDRELYISTNFGEWVNTSFIPMINSGDYKITTIESDRKNCKRY